MTDQSTASLSHGNNFPKLHNAAWPGVVGKGGEGADPCIDLDTMLALTAAAEFNGQKFDGIDLFLHPPHFNIDAVGESSKGNDLVKKLADQVQARNLVVGTVVAPVWPETGGGSAMNSGQREKFIHRVYQACVVAQKLRELGVRPHGCVRIDSACKVKDWAEDPTGNQHQIAQTFRLACDIAQDHGENLVAEGEVCWGGMHSWKLILGLLKEIGRPENLGFQADMAHTLLYLLGVNRSDDRLLPHDFFWDQTKKFDAAYKTLTDALRPWTLDFHVAQNDGTVYGSGSHDKTGRHCLPNDPDGKLKIAHHAGFWLRDQAGRLTRTIRHICWDGCMFHNNVMMKPETWNDILRVMIEIRDAHGWYEPESTS
jgi:hypothetical protein